MVFPLKIKFLHVQTSLRSFTSHFRIVVTESGILIPISPEITSQRYFLQKDISLSLLVKSGNQRRSLNCFKRLQSSDILQEKINAADKWYYIKDIDGLVIIRPVKESVCRATKWSLPGTTVTRLPSRTSNFFAWTGLNRLRRRGQPP